MAGQTLIVRASPPRGVWKGGVLLANASVLPGTVMEFTATPVAGNLTWQVFQPGTDGAKRMIAVLVEPLDGGLPSVAIPGNANGTTWIEMYWPLPGESMLMQLAPGEGGSGYGSGTGPNQLIGESLIVQSGTGLLIPTYGTPGSIPFRLEQEVDYNVAGDEINTLAACMATGQ